MPELWTLIVAALAVLAPAVAAVHIVLTKRNSSAAVAWMGLVWLAPLLGVLSYLVLGINRIHRRAVAIRKEDRDDGIAEPVPPFSIEELEEALGPDDRHLVALARLGTRIGGQPLVGGNDATLLENGDEAVPAMLEAIEGAERSVSLCTYIFDVDPTGRRFLEALSGAVGRGVEVRVLIDAVGVRYSQPRMNQLLAERGVRVALFHPELLPWRMPYFNLRNHRKILVTDGRVGFTGGMNLRQGHMVKEAPEHPVRDIHTRLEGPIVQSMQRTFAEDWLTTTGEKLRGEGWFPELDPVGKMIARGIPDGPDVDFEQILTLLLGALAVADRRVRIVTPYFIPDERLVDALGVAAMRGVEVELFLPEKPNLTLVQWASQAYWPVVLEKDVRIFLTGAPFDHSKMMTVDGAWGMIGSANWDPRSLQLNFEFNVESYDGGFVAELERAVDRRAAGAREVTRAEVDGRPIHLRLRDGTTRLLSPLL
ncbi:MAG: cardiolipin synthase [Gemmatimonadota bacterium]